MSNNKLTIYDKDWKWSYSQLNSFDTCKKMFYEIYINKNRGSQNAFGQFGTFMHGIMEMYGNGEINLNELVSYYKLNYSKNVPLTFPESKFCNMEDIYYSGGLRYLTNFYGFKDKTIHCEYNVNGLIETNDGESHNFGGIIDRVSMDQNGDIILSDYKSKSNFKTKAERNKYYRQLYVYAYLFWKSEGVIPKKLRFVLMRAKTEDKVVVEKDFDFAEMNDSINWLKETITSILSCKEWNESESEFFCKSLCAVSVFECLTKEKLFTK